MTLGNFQLCTCGSGYRKITRLDGHGIFLCYACDKCWPRKLKGYRPDILEQYPEHPDDPIEGD
jgi:hypothetical protein